MNVIKRGVKTQAYVKYFFHKYKTSNPMNSNNVVFQCFKLRLGVKALFNGKDSTHFATLNDDCCTIDTLPALLIKREISLKKNINKACENKSKEGFAVRQAKFIEVLTRIKEFEVMKTKNLKFFLLY
jgi:hypothetical protein